MSLAALESENQRVDRDGFRKGHAEDAERKHAPKGAWVASDSFRRLRAHQADSDPGTEARHAQGETTGYTRGHSFCSKNRKDHILALLWVVFSHRPQTCTVPVGNFLMLLFLVMSCGELNIDGAEQSEDKRLQQSDQQFKKVERYRNDDTHQISDGSRKAQRVPQSDH